MKRYTPSHNIIWTLLLLHIVLESCNTLKVPKDADYSVRFLDDHTLSANIKMEELPLGGLSGIAYLESEYVLICDQLKTPRYYTATLPIIDNKIDTIIITSMTRIKDTMPLISPKALDMESVRKTNGGFLISTEGHITSGIAPVLFKINRNGYVTSRYDIPQIFNPQENKGPRHNAAFEGLTIDQYNGGFWVATELPLQQDGPKPRIYNTKSPIRFSYFNTEGVVERQYAYNLERIQKIPFLPFGINGVTEILQLSEKEFIVLERSYSAGRGKRAYTVQLFLSSIENASEVLGEESLKRQHLNVMDKELLINLKSIRSKLTEKRIDNIEGITFGPRLPNGNLSLILIADNNFNSFGKQLNQFILLELIKN